MKKTVPPPRPPSQRVLAVRQGRTSRASTEFQMSVKKRKRPSTTFSSNTSRKRPRTTTASHRASRHVDYADGDPQTGRQDPPGVSQHHGHFPSHVSSSVPSCSLLPMWTFKTLVPLVEEPLVYRRPSRAPRAFSCILSRCEGLVLAASTAILCIDHLHRS